MWPQIVTEMKKEYPKQNISSLCELFGRQARTYHKRIKVQVVKDQKHEAIISYTRQLRVEQKKIGTKKIQYLLNKHKEIKIGRDALSNILRSENLLVKNVKRYRPKYTDGNGKSIYPDLRKELGVKRINQLWCSDITYLELRDGKFAYLVCVTDEYSHLIVGYDISKSMKTAQVLAAMQMGVDSESKKDKRFNFKLIIHSDRGSQYKSKDFKAFAHKHEIKTSMCAKGKSHENPVAERLNGILKHELGCGVRFKNLEEAREKIVKSIQVYNEKRPHLSCEMLTPKEAHEKGEGVLKKLWKQRVNYKSKHEDD